MSISKKRNKYKDIKLDKKFVLVSLLILVVAGLILTYCIITGNYFNALFVCIFCYYVIKLYAINYFDID